MGRIGRCKERGRPYLAETWAIAALWRQWGAALRTMIQSLPIAAVLGAACSWSVAASDSGYEIGSDFHAVIRRYGDTSRPTHCTARTDAELQDGAIRIKASATFSQAAGEITASISVETEGIEPADIVDAVALLPVKWRTLEERAADDEELLARGKLSAAMRDDLANFVQRVAWWVQEVKMIDGTFVDLSGLRGTGKFTPEALKRYDATAKSAMLECVVELVEAARSCREALHDFAARSDQLMRRAIRAKPEFGVNFVGSAC